MKARRAKRIYRFLLIFSLDSSSDEEYDDDDDEIIGPLPPMMESSKGSSSKAKKSFVSSAEFCLLFYLCTGLANEYSIFIVRSPKTHHFELEYGRLIPERQIVALLLKSAGPLCPECINIGILQYFIEWLTCSIIS